jgi:hypothetical protein
VTAENSDDAYEIASDTWSDNVSARDLATDYADGYGAEVEDDVDIEVE